MNATDTRFRSRSGAAREKPIAAWRRASPVAAAAAAVVAIPAAAAASTGSSPVVGHVYVNDNTAGGSNYTGFRLTRVGRLAPVPGSTVALPSGSQPGAARPPGA